MKIEKKLSERRPSALSKEEIVPEATVVQFADDNENKKTDLRSRQKDLKRMSFTKKKGSAEFDLKKVLDEATTKNPTKPRVQAGGFVCQGNERKINTKITNRRAVGATRRKWTSHSQSTQREKLTQSPFQTGKIPFRTNPKELLTRFPRHTNSINTTRASFHRCPTTLKTQDPPK